jgi:hypothetical protein
MTNPTLPCQSPILEDRTQDPRVPVTTTNMVVVVLVVVVVMVMVMVMMLMMIRWKFEITLNKFNCTQNLPIWNKFFTEIK